MMMFRRDSAPAALAILGILAAVGCKPQESPAASTPAASVEAPAKPPASVPGPVAGTRITEAYARMVARDAYFWAWPMVNVYNKRLAFSQIPEPGLMNGVLPGAPLNRMGMLTDYVAPTERFVACPN